MGRVTRVCCFRACFRCALVLLVYCREYPTCRVLPRASRHATPRTATPRFPYISVGSRAFRKFRLIRLNGTVLKLLSELFYL